MVFRFDLPISGDRQPDFLKDLFEASLAWMINDWLNQFEKTGKAFVPFRSEGWQGMFHRDGFLLLTDDDIKCWIVPSEDIALLEAYRNFTLVHFPRTSCSFGRFLGDCERRLNSSIFCIVNLSHVKQPRLSKDGRLIFVLSDGKEVVFLAGKPLFSVRHEVFDGRNSGFAANRKHRRFSAALLWKFGETQINPIPRIWQRPRQPPPALPQQVAVSYTSLERRALAD